ncbi:MAG: DUF4136 domain-containing protein [Bryobacter sp.]|jgi:hypothetical protein|nr:DUF4136 domain-containing protein [Bryobacter sp.]
MKRLVFLLLPLALFAKKPVQYVDKNFDFKAVKTYSWLPGRVLTKQGVVENPPGIHQAIHNVVNTELAARGWKEIPQGGDLEVTYGAGVDAGIMGESINMQAWVPYTAWVPSMPGSSEVRIASLVLNFIIPGEKKKTAFARIEHKGVKRNQDYEALAKELTQKVMKNFPLKASQ